MNYNLYYSNINGFINAIDILNMYNGDKYLITPGIVECRSSLENEHIANVLVNCSIFVILIENKNTTLKKEYLFNTIWGSDSETEFQSLTVHIKWLREKIENNPKEPKHIITVWGVGYRYE